MSMLKAIRNHIIFQFEDEIVRKSNLGQQLSQFADKTDWGFEISSYDEGAKNPRWGIVYSVGHEAASDVKVGDRILIEALQWTEAASFEGVLYWRTNVEKVMAVDDSI